MRVGHCGLQEYAQNAPQQIASEQHSAEAEQAVLGGRVTVPTPAGPVTMTVPKWSNSGTVLRLKGKGAPGAGGARGDEYVTLKVMLPDKPDPELERFLTERAARTRGARQSTEA